MITVGNTSLLTSAEDALRGEYLSEYLDYIASVSDILNYNAGSPHMNIAEKNNQNNSSAL